MPVRVILADLRYNYSGVLANDCMPLGIAYMKAVMDREYTSREVVSRLFVYPERLLEALKADPPDVLMLSNYVWNEALSHHFCKIAKQINPKILTVLGGPNISMEPERQIRYLAAAPYLDVYALGEGDFLASNILASFMNAELSLSALASHGLDSCVYRDPAGNAVMQPDEAAAQGSRGDPVALADRDTG